jgi:hypothetical protein
LFLTIQTSLRYFENAVQAPYDGVNYGAYQLTNAAGQFDGGWTSYADFFEPGFVGRAHGDANGVIRFGDSSFQVSGDASGLWQSFADGQNHTVGGYASTIESSDLVLLFANPTLFQLHGEASGAASGDSAGGGADLNVTWSAGVKTASGAYNISMPAPIIGVLDVAGLTSLLQLNIRSSGFAGAQNLTNSAGAGIGSGFITGTYDTNVINPAFLWTGCIYQLSGKPFGQLREHCQVSALGDLHRQDRNPG